MNDNVSTRDIQLAADILSKLEPGFLPLPIFHEIMRLTMTPILEVVPLRRKEKGIEILLLKRADNDPIWPNMLHTPGTVLRSTDTLDSAFSRLLKTELGGVKSSQPVFVTNTLHHSGRGMEASLIYFINIESKVVAGQFYDINQLPDSLVKTQLDFIPIAIEAYKARF